jgi:hypothetical protein
MICCVAMVHEARPCFVVILGGCATSLPHGMYHPHHSATACRSQGDIFPGETPVAQNVALCLFSTFFCLRMHTIIRSTKSIPIGCGCIRYTRRGIGFLSLPAGQIPSLNATGLFGPGLLLVSDSHFECCVLLEIDEPLREAVAT